MFTYSNILPIMPKDFVDSQNDYIYHTNLVNNCLYLFLVCLLGKNIEVEISIYQDNNDIKHIVLCWF